MIHRVRAFMSRCWLTEALSSAEEAPKHSHSPERDRECLSSITLGGRGFASTKSTPISYGRWVVWKVSRWRSIYHVGSSHGFLVLLTDIVVSESQYRFPCTYLLSESSGVPLENYPAYLTSPRTQEGFRRTLRWGKIRSLSDGFAEGHIPQKWWEIHAGRRRCRGICWKSIHCVRGKSTLVLVAFARNGWFEQEDDWQTSIHSLADKCRVRVPGATRKHSR